MSSIVLDVAIPVRERPHRLRPVLDAVLAAATVPTRVIFLADHDDLPTLEVLARLDALHAICPFARGWDTATFSSKVNVAYRTFDAPFLAMFGDDVHPVRGWDREVLDVFARSRSTGVVSTNDLTNPRVMAGRAATHPVVARGYVESYRTATADDPAGPLPDPVLSEAYRHAYTDGELVHVARARGAFEPCLPAIVEHLHPQRGHPTDGIYRLGRSFHARDRATQRKRLAAFDARRQAIA